ncbi:D-alanine-D-alanine ligase [Pelagirhabdus alkalitolerans]|uniref:D-alanine-D-alanine ligase n=1 Tax=Pelagirhabdus alkalitolerans TaxID=1612202 RepID=A0A1G6GHL2_9BACI|nr:ATP-grasp domain-containing protein [Pelagirhabdus alkalitolerans]SDB81245.1 D-alanine-D-alanine ligase [Pelagirhabdus alkalitolerans]
MDYMVDQLSHLDGVLPPDGYNNRLSVYLIALEAWRRGVSVQFFVKNEINKRRMIYYKLKYKDTVRSFQLSESLQLSKTVKKLCRDKNKTKRHLESIGIDTPKGFNIDNHVTSSMLKDMCNELSFPVTIKPVDGQSGRGVYPNIKCFDDLLDVFNYLVNELKYHNLLLEEYVQGEEHRFFGVGNEIVAVTKRTPAHVVGNGKDTINELIKHKNRLKEKNVLVYNKKIKVDHEVNLNLENNNYSLDSILPKGEMLKLREKSNISSGGDHIDVTDEISEEAKILAQEAIKSIEGIELSGVDMIINPKTKRMCIIEVNTRPMVGLHLFPLEGKPRDVIKPIIDFYFPELKNNYRSNLYFDFKSIQSTLNNSAVSRVTLKPLRYRNEKVEKHIIEFDNGDINKIMFKLKSFCILNNINGYVKEHKQDQIEMCCTMKKNESIIGLLTEFHIKYNYKLNLLKSDPLNIPLLIGFRIVR